MNIHTSDFGVGSPMEWDWTISDLGRVGEKLQEFATDPFYPDHLKRSLLSSVSTAIRRFEQIHHITVT